MSTTPRHGLPLLAPGQAQKELFHNEALLALDCLVGGAVEGLPSDTPPASPVQGSCYLIGSNPTGAWAGKSGQIAAFGPGGWRFLVPTDGASLLVKNSGVRAEYRAGSWTIGTVRANSLSIGGVQVVAGQAAAIASPSGGTSVDSAARTAIDQILAALRQHGLIAT